MIDSIYFFEVERLKQLFKAVLFFSESYNTYFFNF